MQRLLDKRHRYNCICLSKHERKSVKYLIKQSTKKMLAHTQDLVYTLKELMPTQYQKDNLEAISYFT
ncbi:hypothetical protein ACX27_16780 [Nostoc piscinale CENA21]|uniref:Uncharacterized protein n=1 Tax=Nostoc piscinale CENA21 TaxID=224013 RepID=A0A0M3V5L4_9NOSO|nr:hypothetical protein ACX27_16780 [Nostoc piscinale CENA21]